jgi:hypothetical protein
MLGQSEEILERIRSKKSHPAMAAFGLWRDEDDLDTLAEEIRRNRSGKKPERF